MTPLRFILALLTHLSLATATCAATSPCVSPTNTWPTLTVSPIPAIQYQGQTITVTVTMTVTTPSNNRNTCIAGLQLDPGSPNGTLSGPGGATLAYTASGFFPWDPGWNRTNVSVPPNTTISYAFTITVPGGQASPVGSYSSPTFQLRLYDVLNGGIIRETYFNIPATVITTCELPPPDVSLVDFSAAVSGGRIPAPIQRQVTFFNAGCNGPSQLTLSGAPMEVSASSTARIFYTAEAPIGPHTVSLDTSSALIAFAQTSSATSGSNIPLTITIQPTAILPAGRYRSTLTVSLTPAQ